MEYEEDIKKLENNVERLLGSLDTAQDDRRKLRAEISRLELGKKELEDEVKRLREEKKVIHQRVSALIASIEKWEKSSPIGDGHPASAGVAVAGKGPEPVQGVLVGN
jgi:chromosome segregation ATPase